MKKIIAVLIAAVTAMSLISCGNDSVSEASSSVNAEVSAWDKLNDKEKDFYENLEKKGHTIEKDTGYVYIDAAGYEDEWGRTYGNEGIVITYWFGNEDIVHVPEEIDGKKVVNAANLAMWRYCDTKDENNNLGYTFKIKELYFPEDFQEVYCAFDHRDTLEKIELPKSQTTIQYGAFMSSGLKSFNCPDNLEIIQDQAFLKCESLTEVNFNDGLKEIWKDAFSYCENLTTLSFPDSVEKIDEFAFNGCKGLVEVELPNSITTLSKCVFAHCTSLTEIKIPDSVVEICEDAFSVVMN